MPSLLNAVATAMLAVALGMGSAPAGAELQDAPATPTPEASPATSPRGAAPPSTPAPSVTLGRPQPLKVALVGGGSVVGQIVAWDVDGLDATVDGGPKRLTWDEIVAVDLYRLRKRLIDGLAQGDRRRAGLDLAAYLFSRPDAESLTSRAFEDARRWGADPTEREATKARGEAIRAAREERVARADRARLSEGSPEADLFPTTAWPPLTAEEQAAETAALRRETLELLVSAGREATPVESKHCLVFSALGIEDGARRATEIDEFIEASLPRLGRPREEVPWHGRLVVLVSEDRDRFSLIEAAAFKRQPRADEIAITHYEGPKAFVHCLHQLDATSGQSATFRAVALALLHRFGGSTRPPAWANEGFADWLVAQHRTTKTLDASLRRVGLRSARDAGGFARTIAIDYAPRQWPFRDALMRGESFVLTSYLAERHGERFVGFLRGVKSGEPWRSAFRQAFGRPVEQLAAEAWEFHRLND